MRALEWLVVIAVIAAGLTFIIVGGSFIINHLGSQPPLTWDCINMNGHEIEPNPELCKASCEAKVEWEHMQAHYDEVCRCCNYRKIDYKDAGPYQERVYVVNADGSRGEDRTCAYFPEAEGCNQTAGV